MLTINYILIKEGCEPTRKHSTDACYDLKTSNENNLVIHKDTIVVLGTGVMFDIPAGFFGLVLPRSSAGKNGIRLVNTAGVIDSGYQGEVIVNFMSDRKFILEPFSRLFQIAFIPVPETKLQIVKTFEKKSARGAGGFGSTGTK